MDKSRYENLENKNNGILNVKEPKKR